jgi:hypothetical protein
MTKKTIIRAAAVAIAMSLLSAQPGLSAAMPSKAFKNCTELRKTYPGGVAKSKSSTNKGGKIKKKPAVNAKVYASNKQMDRDGDGIACEN